MLVIRNRSNSSNLLVTGIIFPKNDYKLTVMPQAKLNFDKKEKNIFLMIAWLQQKVNLRLIRKLFATHNLHRLLFILKI